MLPLGPSASKGRCRLVLPVDGRVIRDRRVFQIGSRRRRAENPVASAVMQVHAEMVHNVVGSPDESIKRVLWRKAPQLHAAPQAVQVGHGRPERPTDNFHLPLLKPVAVQAISTDRPRLGKRRRTLTELNGTALMNSH